MTKFWFLIWLSGAIVSLATIVKYVEVKRMWNYVKEAVGLEDKILVKIYRIVGGIFVFLIVIPSYIALSWLGALATYVTFTDFNE
jgi:hypothetical protein